MKFSLKRLDITMEFDNHLTFLQEYGIIICIACKYAIKPDGIARHFRNQHTRQVNAKDRSSLVQSASLFPLVKPEEVQTPLMPCERIKHLKLMDGVKCTECRHCCISEESIKTHCRDKHSWSASKQNKWTTCYLQSFFAGIMFNYSLLT
jgi:hypothetical protein